MLKLILISLTVFSFLKVNAQVFNALKFGPNELYNAHIAKQVRLSLKTDVITLEGRNFQAPFKGIIESDCIDPADNKNVLVQDKKTLKSIRFTIEAMLPKDASVDLYVSFGNTFYSADGWNKWEKVKGHQVEIKNPKGKYCRFRLILSAPSIEKSPLIKSLTIKADYEKFPAHFQKEIKIHQFENEKLITSQFDFKYERPDNKELEAFVKLMGYDTLIAKNSSNLRSLQILNTAVASTPNHSHDGWSTDYPFDPREICSLQDRKMSIKGHCMSYAVVLINSLTAFGYYSRHWSANGFRDMDHEVVEVWVDSLRKWIYLDPSLSQFYLDPKTNNPLSLKEMHDIYTRFALLPGETFNDLSRDSLMIRINSKGVGRGKLAPILCVDSGWHYGGRVDSKVYDWGWFHGYMVSGFLRLTERNNYVSQREPWFSDFGNGIVYNSHLHWIDDATPPRTSNIQTYTGRERDLWWSLNQASIKAVRTSENIISLEFGNTQPFFKQYLVFIDNKSPITMLNGLFSWKLHSGENKVKVIPEDIFGNRGIPSFISLTF